MSKLTTQNASSELITLAIAGLDAQIQELQQKKESLLAQVASSVSAPQKRARGRAAKKATKATKAVTGKATAKVGGKVGRKPGKKSAKTESTPRKKRQVSPETRQRLKESARARWAREKAESQGASE
jgi:hypothetical protein